MKKHLTIIAAGFGMMLAMANAAFAEETKKPSMARTQQYVMNAVVDSIDYENRQMAIRVPSGKTYQIELDPSMRNIDRIRVGDKVDIEYLRSIGILFRSPATGTVSSDTTVTKPVPDSDKPTIYTVRTVQVVTKVVGVNYLTRVVTVKGPKGNYASVKMERDVKNLWRVRMGDEMVIDYIEALVIKIETTDDKIGQT